MGRWSKLKKKDMANFSAMLFKAASGVKPLPISTARSNEPFVTPMFEDYLAKGDITGYMTELWRGVAARDIESLHVLIYLSIQVGEPEDTLEFVDMLLDTEDDYVMELWKPLKKEIDKLVEDEIDDQYEVAARFMGAYIKADVAYAKNHPAHRSMLKRFGETETTLYRAYLTNVGRQGDAPAEDVEDFKDCAPQEKKDEWRRLYRRRDCSANQIAIYHDAMKYAEKGDPYAMYIVGYLLAHGIETKYSNPKVVLLPADKEKALVWLNNATKAAIRPAFWEVGNIYLWRSNGDDENKDRAMLYITRGAELGDYESLKYMVQYQDDDAAKVAHLERIVEEHDDNTARLQLAEHYEKGLGCKVQPKKAYELAEYVYKHSSVSPYDSSQEDSAYKLAKYLREGFGCEKDEKYAGQIISWLDAENDRMMELLTK